MLLWGVGFLIILNVLIAINLAALRRDLHGTRVELIVLLEEYQKLRAMLTKIRNESK